MMGRWLKGLRVCVSHFTKECDSLVGATFVSVVCLSVRVYVSMCPYVHACIPVSVCVCDSVPCVCIYLSVY